MATIGSRPSPGQLGSLLFGEGGAERGDAEVAAVAGQGDGEGVHRALDEHRDRAARRAARGSATNSWSPLWNSGVSAVLRYFGPALSSSVRSGRRRPTKPSTSPWWIDGEHHAVAEPVDQATGAGAGGDAGGQHLVVADPAAA